MPTETELMTALRNAHDNGDEDGARRIAGMVQELKSQPQVDPAVHAGRNRRGDMVQKFFDSTYSAVLGLGQGFGGIGDAAGAVGQMVHENVQGHTIAPADAYQRARERREAIASENPTNYTIGNIGGLLAGGRVLSRVTPSLAPVAGQSTANIAKAAGTGILGGEIQAAGEGGDLNDIANATASGAFLGPVGTAVGNVVGGTSKAIAGKFPGLRRSGSVDTQAAQLVGERTGLTPDELDTVLTNWQRRNGRPASISDVLELQAKGQLKQFASKNPAFGAGVAEEVERRQVVEPRSQTRDVNQPFDKSSLETEATNKYTAALGDPKDPAALVNQPVANAVEVRALLSTPSVMRAARSDKGLNDEIKAVLKTKSKAALSVGDLDGLRRDLRKVQRAGGTAPLTAKAAKAAADDVEQYLAQKYSEHGVALEELRRANNYIDSFEHGLAGRKQGVAEGPLKASLASPEGQKGYKVGAAERRAAENLEGIAPDYIKPADKLGGSTIAHAAAAATSGSWAFKAYHLLRSIPTLKAPDDVLRTAARYLVDPKLARQGVALLRKQGVKQADITQLTAAVAGARAGQAAVEQQ